MKLRFEVDQAACLRAGIDCPKSIVSVEVNPAKLSQQERDLIADRLDGIDVYKMRYYSSTGQIERTGSRIIAQAPTLEALLSAVSLNQLAAVADLHAADRDDQDKRRMRLASNVSDALDSDPSPER